MTIPSDFMTHLRWAANKASIAFKGGYLQAYLPFAGLAAYGVYRSTLNLKSALFGDDSFEYRKQFFNRFYKESERPYSERMHSLSMAFFGSLSLFQRCQELGYGAAYLATSTLCLYAIQTRNTQKSQAEFGWNPSNDMMMGSEEIYPDYYDFEVKRQALEFYTQNAHFEALFNQTLANPVSSENPADIVSELLQIANKVFLPQKTPLREQLTPLTEKITPLKKYICSTVGDYLTKKACQIEEVVPVSEMNLLQLEKAYNRTKSILLSQAPTDYEGKSASIVERICHRVTDWALGETFCNQVGQKLHLQETNQSTLLIQKLDKLYEVLQFRIRNAMHRPEDYVIVLPKDFKNLKERFSELSEKNKAYFSNFKLEAEENGEYDPFKLEHFRKRAQAFFNLPDQFTIKEFKRIYREYSRKFHLDKCGDNFSNSKEDCLQLYRLNSRFNDVFAKNIAYKDLVESHESNSWNFLPTRIRSIPSPSQVIHDLTLSFFDFWNRP